MSDPYNSPTMASYQFTVNETVVRSMYDEGFPLLMPRWGYVMSAFVLFLIGFFGFFLNLMVILLMFKDRQLWTPLNMILFNLVCSDFSVSVLGNPFTLISALFHRWIFGKTMCVLYGFFMALLGITSITTLTVLSFERYMMVTRPLSSRHLSSKGAVVSIVFIWSYSLALTTPPLLGWGNYVNEAANISCSVNWHEQSMNTLTYIFFLFAMGQIVPFAIISFSYINIIRTIKQNSQRMGRVGRAEAKVTGMVFVMIISFTVAWTPYSVFALMEQFATEGIISPGAGVIPALVAKSSICYDPLIYIGMNTQFRQSIKRLFGIHTKGGTSQTDKGYDNTIFSPAHKFSRSNDMNTRLNLSESNVSTVMKKQVVIKEGKITISEDHFSVTDNEIARPSLKNTNLCTIQENKTASDAEKSGETMYEDESSNGKQKLEVFGESCHLHSDGSPVLTIVDSEKLIFSKPRALRKNNDASDDSVVHNVYGNKGFEDHSSDVTIDIDATDQGTSDADSIAATVSSKDKTRRLPSEKRLIKGTVTTNFFENHDPTQGQECFKTYLYRIDNSSDNGDDQYVVCNVWEQG